MKKKLALRSGDKIIIKDVTSDKLVTLKVCSKLTKHDGEVLLESPLHLFIENLGLFNKPTRTKNTIKIPGKIYFKNIIVLEIKRKQPWYTTILTKVIAIFGKKKV